MLFGIFKVRLVGNLQTGSQLAQAIPQIFTLEVGHIEFLTLEAEAFALFSLSGHTLFCRLRYHRYTLLP